MASAKFQGDRFKIDGEIAENHAILVDRGTSADWDPQWWASFLGWAVTLVVGYIRVQLAARPKLSVLPAYMFFSFV